jgi:hypothetical protein
LAQFERDTPFHNRPIASMLYAVIYYLSEFWEMAGENLFCLQRFEITFLFICLQSWASITSTIIEATLLTYCTSPWILMIVEQSVEWMIGRGNRSTRRKPALVPPWPPQIPHDFDEWRLLGCYAAWLL